VQEILVVCSIRSVPGGKSRQAIPLKAWRVRASGREHLIRKKRTSASSTASTLVTSKSSDATPVPTDNGGHDGQGVQMRAIRMVLITSEN
jgi:hypothetical protein